MNQKVGIADSGIAIALISVARQSRRNRKTTTTASTAPSIIAAIELRYCSFTYSVLVKRILKSTLGLFFLISASFFIVSSWTVTSDDPFAFSIEKDSTCLPRIIARLRCSA